MPSRTICSVCGSKGVSVHAFPSAKYHDIYEKWMEVLSSHEIAMSSSSDEVRQKHRICEKHFKEDDFFIAYRSNKTKKKLLKHNSVPFLNDSVDHIPVTVSDQHVPVPVPVPVNNQVSTEAKLQESQKLDIATTVDAIETEPSVENICIPVDCTRFIPKPNRKRIQDSYKLYRQCMRQQKTIEKQREIIRELKKRLKYVEHPAQSGNKLNDEFVMHQKQNIRKPRGRRYTHDMKLLGAQMLKQGTIAEYEKWRKVFVMPSRRTLKRVSKDSPAQMGSSDSFWESLQIVMNESSKEDCPSSQKPCQPKLATPASD